MRLSGKILGNFFVKYSLNTPANGQSEQNSITDLCFVYYFFRGVGWLLEESTIRQILLKNLVIFHTKSNVSGCYGIAKIAVF